MEHVDKVSNCFLIYDHMTVKLNSLPVY